MGLVQNNASQDLRIVSVWYAGTKTLTEGAVLVYDTDTNCAPLTSGYNLASPPNLSGAQLVERNLRLTGSLTLPLCMPPVLRAVLLLAPIRSTPSRALWLLEQGRDITPRPVRSSVRALSTSLPHCPAALLTSRSARLRHRLVTSSSWTT